MPSSSKPGMDGKVPEGVRPGRAVCRFPKEKDKRKAEVEGAGAQGYEMGPWVRFRSRARERFQ